MFHDAIDVIKKELSTSGIVAADIPECPTHTSEDNAFWGVVMASALGSNVFVASKDQINGTPYTVYAASYAKSQELTEFGMPTVAPETKLGFHTDGVVSGNHVSIPRNLMLYNVVIEYERPGCFHWVPFGSWSEKDDFIRRIAIGKRYSVKLTPSIYDMGNKQLKVATPDIVDVPIFLDDEENGFPLYINGTVLGAASGEDSDPDVFEKLKASIADNNIRYSIPQKSRRAIFVSNILGAHARDIFEKPRGDVPYTGIFLRSVDADAISLN